MNQSSAASVALVFLRAIKRRMTAMVTIIAIAILVFTIVSPRPFLTAILLVVDNKLMILKIFEFRSRMLCVYELENRKS